MTYLLLVLLLLSFYFIYKVIEVFMEEQLKFHKLRLKHDKEKSEHEITKLKLEEVTANTKDV